MNPPHRSVHWAWSPPSCRHRPAPRGSAFAVPFAAGVGAAAFRRGDTDYVVFDQRRPLDLSALRRNRVFWTTSVHLLPAATLLRLRLPPGLTIALHPTPQGWTVAALASPTPPPPRPIVPAPPAGRLLLTARAPGKVITLADPKTGARLLVGTQRQPGQRIAVRRRSPDFVLLPSWQGVLVEALSDRLTLRTSAEGLRLGREPGRLTLPPLNDEALPDAAVLTRRFSFPERADADAAPEDHRGPDRSAAALAGARLRTRRSIARDMLAARPRPGGGIPAAHGDAASDPRPAASASTTGLAAIAALLADRPAERCRTGRPAA